MNKRNMGIYPWVIAPKRPLCQGRLILFVAFLNLLILFPFFLAAQSNPIVFVTQVPKADDFANIVSTFGNHRGTMYAAPRGGDLWIRYVDGSLKNLTETAGFGEAGRQGENAIAVRDPSVHWSGEKVLFSMVVGAPEQFKYNDYRFQLYEVTGLRKDETPVITKVPRQPAQYNNVMGTYAPDDTILFVSDRPVGGATHLYPQLDEYESTPTNTGLWKLTPSTGALEHLDHSPSGDFHPIVDSFGRVLVTRWDHLQQDQQADDGAFGAYNFQSERVNAPIVGGRAEVFPEPRSEERRISRNISLHTFNRFMPWMMNPDGTELETLNHIGRHELGDYFVQSFLNDGELSEFIDDQDRLSDNRYAVDNLFSLREDPTAPGLYFATNGSEFYTHGAGQIVTISGSPSTNANAMVVTSITHPETADPTNNPSPQHSGLYRNPLPLRDGSVVAVHTAETRVDFNSGTREAPRSRYNFRIKQLVKSGKYWQAGAPLTAGIEKSVSYYDPDVLVEYSGELWELQPVELVSRERPVVRTSTVPAIEESVFDDAGITLLEFQAYLAELDLAMVVTRDVRSRDEADKQQPFTLRLGESGKNAVSGLQFLQGSQIRAYESFVSGRRTLAQLMGAILIPEEVKDSSSIGSYRIFPDGSVAAIVPAQRALSWQLVASSGEPIVRERYWVTFQPGEVRVCASCHGLNERDQNGAGVPRNKPEALRAILAWWKSASSRDIRNPDGYLVSPGGDEVQTVRLQVKRRGRRVTIRLPRRYPLSLIADAALVISNPKGKSIERSFGAQRSKIVSLPRRMSQGRITVNLVQGGAILFEKVIRGARR